MGTVNSHWWNRPLNCWWKAVQSITCYSWILSVQLNVHLNWLKIELQSLKCCICWTVLVVSIKFTGYFALCITQYNLCEYSHTNSESLAQMRVTLLKYRMFSRGLFCTVHCFLKKARHLIFDHNFCKCWPIFEILLLVTQNYFFRFAPYCTCTRIPSSIWSRLYGCASRWAAIRPHKWQCWMATCVHDGLWLVGDWASDTQIFFVTDRSVTTWLASHNVREVRLKT